MPGCTALAPLLLALVGLPVLLQAQLAKGQPVNGTSNPVSAASWRAPILRIQGVARKELSLVAAALHAAKDSAALKLKASQAVDRLQQRGYAAARLDSCFFKQDTFTARYLTGPLYYYDSLSLTGAGELLLAESGLAELAQRHSAFTFQGLERHLVKLLQLYEQRGYPFARVQQEQLLYHSQQDSVAVQVRAQLVPGPLVRIDSVVAVGKVREPPAFIRRLVHLEPGQLYDQRTIDAIPTLLNNTPYFQNVKQPQVIFRGDKATVRVPVQPRRSNRFDVLIGLLPAKTGSPGFQFTALVDLVLVSSLRLGEVLNFHFEQLPGSSQKLNLAYQQPNLLGTPFRAELHFDLLKRDTLFLTRNFEPGLAYALTPRLSLRGWYRSRSSTTLGLHAGQSNLVWPPPALLDGKSQLLGIGWSYSSVDNRINPQKGLTLEGDIGLGQKNILRTRGLDSLDYKRLSQIQPRRELRLDVAGYRRVGRQQVAVLAGHAYWLGLKDYFDNDLAFVGGNRLLRGFNENQFLTAAYYLGTAEYRLLLEENSYLGAFMDYGQLQYRNVGRAASQWVLGTGLALAVQTAAGVVSVSYAIGQTTGIPFEPARGRVHIGFISRF